MCRFLMVKSPIRISGEKILESFARMVEKSRAPDGDWQGDGWGISWLNQENAWQTKKSIHPIWRETSVFSRIPDSRFFITHSRSASFPQHKNELGFNQPFVEQPFCFVFNGLLKGISLQVQPADGIGSQKIWTLLKEFLHRYEPQSSLICLKEVLERNSKVIHALNIGLCDKKNIYSYCQYSRYPEYYNLQFFDSPSLKILSSEALEGYPFSPVKTNTIIIL